MSGSLSVSALKVRPSLQGSRVGLPCADRFVQQASNREIGSVEARSITMPTGTGRCGARDRGGQLLFQAAALIPATRRAAIGGSRLSCIVPPMWVAGRADRPVLPKRNATHSDTPIA